MKRILSFFILIITLSSLCIYLKVLSQELNGKITQAERLRQEYTKRLTQLEEIGGSKDYQRWLETYQHYANTVSHENVSIKLRSLAGTYHIQIVDLTEKQGIYELSFLADLDTDVYEFWHAFSSSMPGAISPLLFGLFRPQNPQNKMQGRIQFSLLLE